MADRLPYRITFNSRVPRMLGHDCLTWNSVIRVRGRYMSRTMHAHEYCHIEQQYALGLRRFLFRYLRQSLRHGYDGNAFEQAAHRYAATHSQEFEDVEEVKT